jgi:hypothetical protein
MELLKVVLSEQIFVLSSEKSGVAPGFTVITTLCVLGGQPVEERVKDKVFVPGRAQFTICGPRLEGVLLQPSQNQLMSAKSEA